MSDYRINTRFNLKNESQRKAAEYLQSLGRKRNQFIVEAVLARFSNDTTNNFLENIRQIFREEVQTVVSSQPVSSVTVSTELTEEQKAENAKNVLSDLEMFG